METLEELIVHDEDGALTVDYVRAVSSALAADDQRTARKLTRELHAADLADLIEQLRREERVDLIDKLGRTFDVESLPELEEGVFATNLWRRCPIRSLPRLSASWKPMMRSISSRTWMQRIKRRSSPGFPGPTVPRSGGRSTTMKTPPGASCRPNLSRCRISGRWDRQSTTCAPRKNCRKIFPKFTSVDPAFHTTGYIPVSHVLRNKREITISEISIDHQNIFNVSDDQADVAYKFEQYNLVSAAVVDADNRLVGSITIDDVVDVIQEEAEEDILRLGGVGDEEITGSVWGDHEVTFHLAVDQPGYRDPGVLGDFAV